LAAPLRRATAWLIDVGLFALPAVALMTLVGGTDLLRSLWRLLVTKQGSSGPLPQISPTHLSIGAHMPLEAIEVVAVALTTICCWVGYRVGMTAWRGMTVGKWLCRIRVVCQEDWQRPPNLSRAFARWMVPQAAGILPLPGTGILAYAWLLKDRHSQGAHDKAARTVVVRVPGRGAGPWGPDTTAADQRAPAMAAGATTPVRVAA
jgi:uncharacterized RDD family membrane protein YckC